MIPEIYYVCKPHGTRGLHYTCSIGNFRGEFSAAEGEEYTAINNTGNENVEGYTASKTFVVCEMINFFLTEDADSKKNKIEIHKNVGEIREHPENPFAVKIDGLLLLFSRPSI